MDLKLVIPLCAAGLSLLIVALAEWLHSRRVKRTGALAFGPDGKPHAWISFVPWFRAICLGGMAWALTALLMIGMLPAKAGSGELDEEGEKSESLVLVLDFSPSMNLIDAGDEGILSRKERMREVVTSVIDRLDNGVRYSLICFYTRPMPIVEKAFDKAIVFNVLNDLPIEKAMQAGKTDLAAAANAAVEMVKDYPKRSTTIMFVTDGDTIEMEDILPLPKSVRKTLVVGVGDTNEGISLDGHISRQDPINLRRLAKSLRGDYRDANVKHVPSHAINHLCKGNAPRSDSSMSTSDIALLTFIILGCLYALLPILQQFLGTGWTPTSKGSQEARTS